MWDDFSVSLMCGKVHWKGGRIYFISTAFVFSTTLLMTIWVLGKILVYVYEDHDTINQRIFIAHWQALYHLVVEHNNNSF